MRRFAIVAAVLASLFPALAEERVDLDMVHRIKSEALENSKVMEHLFYLTDVYGPRVTNSPGFFGAADWGLEGVGVEVAAGLNQGGALLCGTPKRSAGVTSSP